MTNIITLSLESGEIPSFLKEGWITPIWKGTDREDPKDYRPISLTSHTIKIMERVIRESMTEFLVTHNLIEDSQHGSRNGRGTLTQLIRQHDLLIEKLAEGRNMDLVYLDFSKAFDLVDHSILLH